MKKPYLMLLFLLFTGFVIAEPYQWHSAPICGDKRGTDDTTFVNAPNFSHPYGVAVAGNGRVWTSSYYGNDRYDAAIMVWDPVTEILDTVGPEIEWNGVADTIGLCRFMQTTGEGNIAYGDWTNEMITVFDQNTYEVVARSELGLNTGGGMNAFYYNNNQYYITQLILGSTVVIYDASFNVIYTLEGRAGGRNVYCSRDGSVIISPSLGGNHFIEWRGNVIDGYTGPDTVYLEDINVDMGNLMYVSRNGSVNDNLWLFSRDAANDGVYVVDPFNDYNILIYTNTDPSVTSVEDFSLGMAADNQYDIWLQQGLIDSSYIYTPLGDVHQGGYYQPWVLRAPCQVAGYVDAMTGTEYLYLADFYGYTLKCWERDYIQEPESITISVKDAANTLDLSFGWADAAGDGYDPDYDQYAPPSPPSGSFDARLSINYEDYLKDYRETPIAGESIIWNLSFCASSGNGPIVLEWDPSALPLIGTFTLQDPYEGAIVSLDMRDTSSYMDTDTAPDQLQIVYTYNVFNANFTSDVQSGAYPLDVQFTDLSSGDITSWNWDFGDGNTSTEQNPRHTYNEKGVYTVSLNISNGEYDDQLIREDYITVYHPNHAVITEIIDVPEDQGGWVYVNFSRSRFDTDTLNIITMQDSTQMYTVEINEGDGWVTSNSSVAYGAESYSVLAHTTVDSSATSNGLLDFRVIAGMRAGIFESNIMSGYSVDNLAPATPTGLSTTIAAAAIQLEWNSSSDKDFQYFNIYRSINEDFTNDIQEIYASTIENSFIDEDVEEEKTYYYQITAVDFHDNESDPSETVSLLVGVDMLDAIPQTYQLSQNFPNPFNPTTTLQYGLPEASDVDLMIFDLSGRKIKSWHTSDQQPGWHEVIWDGTDMNGNVVSTGVYIYSLRAGDFVDTRKMVFMK